MIEFRTLGPVDVLQEGSPLSGRSVHRKNLALLVYLGRSPECTRTRDQLVGLLWADKQDQTARHSLRQAVRDLKASLGDGLFVASANALGLAANAVQFDFDQLERLREQGRWTEAASLVRGEFLEGFSVPGASAFEDWLSYERDTWRRRSVEVLLAAAHEVLSASEVVAAADFAATAMAVDPDSDAAVQLAMRCAAIEGNPARALELHRQFAQRLQEIGLEPNAETRELLSSVQQERQWNLSLSEGGDTEPTRRTPMVGRSAELRSALAEWAQFQHGKSGGMVLVEGEQGTGKTRFAEEIATRARLDGAHTAWIRAVEADERTAWSGVMGLFAGGLSDTPGLAGADAPDLAAVATIAPELKSRFPTTTPATSVPLDVAVPRILRAACEEQPLLLVFDDAHFLDTQSLDLIQVVARDLATYPVVMLLTCSPQHPRAPIEDVRARLGRELHGRGVRLGPFSDEDIVSLGRFFLPQYDDEQIQRLTRRIAHDSGRIPLLAVELLHAVALGLRLEESTSDWPQPGRTLDQSAPGELPDAVIGAIRAAFWRAAEPARTVMQVVAALKGRVPRRQIGAASALPPSVLDPALDWLEWERWMVSERRGYMYAARIVQDVIARDMLMPGQAQRYRDAVAASSDA